MNKKGQSEVLTTTLIFELIIGVLVATILLYAVLNINNASSFNKEYAKQDLFLIKGMVKSLPGDLDMKYSTGDWCLTDSEDFTKGSNCKVRIIKTGDTITVQKG